jgi:hypothetical protein
MGRTILWAEFLSAPDRGSMVSAAVASLIVTGSAAIVGSEVIATFEAIVDSVVIAVSMATAGSVGMGRSEVAVVSTAVTDFAAAVAVHMVAVASTEVAEVTAVDVANAA